MNEAFIKQHLSRIRRSGSLFRLVSSRDVLRMHDGDANVIIVGAGVYGLSTALSFAQRGFTNVCVIEQSAEIPHRLSASGDWTRVVRADYGACAVTTRAALIAIERWRKLRRADGLPLLHETGMLFVNSKPWGDQQMEPLAFATLKACGVPVLRMSEWSSELRTRLSNIVNLSTYVDGYFNPWGGFAEARAYTEYLYKECLRKNVRFMLGTEVREFQFETAKGSSLPHRLLCTNGQVLSANRIVLCMGAYIAKPEILQQLVTYAPALKSMLRLTAHPIMYWDLSTCSADTQRWMQEAPVVCPDMNDTGYYIFPGWRSDSHAGKILLKLGHHGTGYQFKNAADAFSTTTTDEICSAPSSHTSVVNWPSRIASFRSILTEVYPASVSSRMKLHEAKLCCYCDSADEVFCIDDILPGVTLASGDSGHAFKFGPVLGEVIADAVLHLPKDQCDPDLYDFQMLCRLSAMRYQAASHTGKQNSVSMGDAMRSKL
ncbi:mitochondrial NAD/FAD-dependent oxidoreductase (sarcosine oxidase) [Andalucia godoyi]|uniref:Mitochondrial NAD/FAD-dependent oxidoreductase (Sarcosine oxidase) n=1 Tax=Andalucia godoyi TaxID=505711 RepID=A0A8K0AGN7_ANDGO|nr:mitochondrial NAD/FAD-dependent oxidoreductase (sarcosine oxidase) [Andalucia godoyi]|eukprot:ANDGO_03999.mRNA.1 mitochondrial NAD/FAD-dependent oxidoreductase (sarcosine oxidase)